MTPAKHPKQASKAAATAASAAAAAKAAGEKIGKSCFSIVFSMNPWPKPVLKPSDNCPDHFAPVWRSPDHSQPIFQLLPIFIFLYIFPTPAPTLATPCFLFLAPTSPQDLQIRIKRRELVLKAARISNFITSAPFWCKINAKFRPNLNFWLCIATLSSYKKVRI